MREGQGTAGGGMVIGDMNGPVMYWGPARRPAAVTKRVSCVWGAGARPSPARGGSNERAAA